MTDLDAALSRVTQYIQQHPATPPGFTVSITTWDLPDAGLRVAEVDWVSADRRAGATFMQRDLPFGLAVCAQVERCVITVALLGDDEDEVESEFASLNFLLSDQKET